MKKRKIEDRKEPVENRLIRIEQMLHELLARPRELTQDDWLKIMNKSAQF